MSITGKVIGADRVARALARLEKLAPKYAAEAQEKNGADLVRLMTVLHPGDGANKAAIKGHVRPDGFLVDAGPKAKVTEGRRAPRPFVNPALKASMKRRRARIRRAAKRAVREAFGG
jgi:hypothetical protein